MTHLDEHLFAHHNGRGNTKSALNLLVEAVRKLSTDVELIKGKLNVTSDVVAAKPTAKISPDEVVNALKTKVDDVVAEVGEEVKAVVAEVEALVKDVETDIETEVDGVTATTEVPSVSTSPETAPTAKKKTK
jgi:hypothetical protein